MKRFLTLLLMVFLVVGMADAQNDMRKRFEERRARQRERYEQKRSEQQKKFDEFRRKRNARYVEQLSKPWKQYAVTEVLEESTKKDSVALKKYQAEILNPQFEANAFGEITLDVTTPLPTKNDTLAVIKIDTVIVVDSVSDLERLIEDIRLQVSQRKNDTVIPVVDTTVVNVLDTTQLEIKVEEVINIVDQPQPQPSVNIEPLEDEIDMVSIALYGTLVSIPFPQDADLQLPSIDEYGISNLWGQIADTTAVPTKFDITITSCLQHRTNMKLCDWAYIRMIQSVAKKRYGNTNEATIFTAYIMAESGYKVRLAYQEDVVFIMFASHHELYKLLRIMIEDEFYYILDYRVAGEFFISNVGYEGEQRFSLLIADEQKVDYELSDTIAATSFKGSTLTRQVNMNLIHFYEDYPSGKLYNGDENSKWLIGAKTPLDSIAKSTFYPQVRELVNGLTTWQAVGKILEWMQSGLKYGYDDEIWGRDRMFFPSETLYYPYADCEDKAILFSAVVRDVLNLDVLLLYWDEPVGHLATAINFPIVEGNAEYVMYNDKKYVICDPTCHYAPVGRRGPSYRGYTPKIMVID